MDNNSSKRIIMVDDNEHFRIYMSMFLEDDGYAVTAFGRLADAVSYIKTPSNVFTTMLLDYFDNGLAVDQETLLALRPQLNGARLILMSACDAKDRLKIEDLVKRGVVDGFLYKTPNYKAIKKSIDGFLL